MSNREDLLILGFHNERLYLQKPTGEQIAIKLSELEQEDIDGIKLSLSSGAMNWNETAPAPVKIIADVTKDANGRYVSIGIIGYMIDNE